MNKTYLVRRQESCGSPSLEWVPRSYMKVLTVNPPVARRVHVRIDIRIPTGVRLATNGDGSHVSMAHNTIYEGKQANQGRGEGE